MQAQEQPEVDHAQEHYGRHEEGRRADEEWRLGYHHPTHVVLLSQAGQFIRKRCLVRLVTFPGQIPTNLVNLTCHYCAAKLKGYWFI